MNFDTLLETRLGNGIFQYKSFFVLSLIDFIDGSESAFLGILLRLLKEEWSLDQSQTIFLGSMFGLGMFFGTLACALFVDNFGRKNTIVFLSFCQVVIILSCVLCYNFYLMCFLRLLFGFLFGITMPISAIMLSEISTKNYRGRYLAAICLIYQFGKVSLVSLCFVFLQDFATGNWRGLFLMNATVAFLCFLLSLTILDETPRFTLSKGQYEEAFRVIDEIGRSNKGNEYEPLTNEEKDEIILSEQQRYVSRDTKFTDLFNQQYRLITITLFLLFGLFHAMNTGMYILLPFLLQSQSKGFGSLLITYVGEIIAIIIVFLLIDNVKTGGRRGILVLTSFLIIFLSFVMFYTRDAMIILLATLIKMQYRLIQPTLSSMAGESYLTLHRSLGVAGANFFGRFIAIFSPLLYIPLFDIDPFLPFVANALLALLQFLLTIVYPLNKTSEDLEGAVKEHYH